MQSDSSLLHDPSMRGFGRSYSSVSPEVSSAINAKRNIGVGGMRGHPNGNGGMRGHPNSNGGGMPGGGMPGGGGLGMESGGGYYHDTSHALVRGVPCHGWREQRGERSNIPARYGTCRLKS